MAKLAVPAFPALVAKLAVTTVEAKLAVAARPDCRENDDVIIVPITFEEVIYEAVAAVPALVA